MTGKFKRKASRYDSQKEEKYWKPTVLCDGECSSGSNKITHSKSRMDRRGSFLCYLDREHDADFVETGRRLADRWYKKLKTELLMKEAKYASGQVVQTLTGHSNVANSVAFSLDGISGSCDSTMKVCIFYIFLSNSDSA